VEDLKVKINGKYIKQLCLPAKRNLKGPKDTRILSAPRRNTTSLFANRVAPDEGSRAQGYN
jgi:hypothetical protein